MFIRYYYYHFYEDEYGMTHIIQSKQVCEPVC
jgi:hypothetical protein